MNQAKQRKFAVIGALLVSTAFLFQNCKSDVVFTSTLEAASEDGIVTPNPNPVTPAPEIPISANECTPVSTAEEFFQMKNGTSKKVAHYCLTRDLDFTGFTFSSSSSKSLSYVLVEGNNHHLYGVTFSPTQSFFSSLRGVTLRNLTVGHPSFSNSVAISKTPTGILARSVDNSKLENIKLMGFVTSEPGVAEGNCGVLFGYISGTQIDGIAIQSVNDLDFRCDGLGFIAFSIRNESQAQSIKNISIVTRGKIVASAKRGMGGIAVSGDVFNVDGINVDIANLELEADPATQNSFGGVFRAVYFSFNKTERMDFKNISVKGNFKLKNITGMGFYASDCGGITRTDEANRILAIDKFSIQSTVSIDNSVSDWGAGHLVGSLCGSSDIKSIRFTNGSIRTTFNLTATRLHQYARFSVGGLVGHIHGDQTVVDLSLSSAGSVTIKSNSPNDQIRRFRYMGGSSPLRIAPGSAELVTTFNSANVN